MRDQSGPDSGAKRRVLIVGPGKMVRGGITSVIQAYLKEARWGELQSEWLETYDDRSAFHKIVSFALALTKAPFAIHRADIVHVHTSLKVSMVRKLPFVVMSKLRGKPVIVHVHAPDVEHMTVGVMAPACRALVRYADCVIALSATWAEKLRPYCSRIEVVPNPVLTVELPGPTQFRSDQGTIAFLGKLEPRKGFEVLIRSMSRVVERFPQSRLVFFGHGDLERAIALVRELGLGDSVRFEGWIDRERLIRDYLHSVQIVCLPSFREGLPMAVLDSMALGVPVVSTPVGGLPEYFNDGQHIAYVAIGDDRQLAESLIRLLGDVEAREAMGRAGRARALSLFAPEKIVSQLFEIYGSIVD